MAMNLVIAKATEAQLHQTYKNNYVEWGKLLTFEHYAKHEELPKFGGSQGFSAWVLVPSDDLETLDLRAHCETFRHTALITTRPGTVEEKTVQAVASVFVPVEKRSNGFGKMIMALLYEHFKREGGPELSILHSDIGPNFYSNFGWVAFKSVEARYDIVDGDSDVADEIAGVKLLRDADIDVLSEHDTVLLREELSHCDKPAIAIVPDAAKFRWMIRRSDYYTALLDYSPIEIIGAHVKGTDSFAIFYHDFVDRVTVCIRFRSDSVDATRKLVRAGKQQAARYGLGAVIVWDPRPDVHGEEAVVVDRDHSISSLAWFGQEGLRAEDFVWIANEKYGWV